MPSFSEYLRPLVPCLSPDLISGPAFSDIQFIARLLPGALAYSSFGFECRLGEDMPRTDFLLCATASSGGRRGLLQLGQGLLTQAAWRQVHNFATHWANPSSQLYANVDNIWLEFDVDGTYAQNPLPSVFFGLHTRSGPDAEQLAPTCVDDITITRTALNLLTGSEVSPAILERLSGCFEMLPAGAQIGFIGAMLARNTPLVRCIVRGMLLEEIVEYLSSIGWEGPVDDFKNAFAPICDLMDFFWLNIDVGETIGPKIGLECYCYSRPDDETKWHRFLDYLVQNGLCTEQKRRALLQYPGISHINASDDLWPESLRLASQLFGPIGFTMLERELHHVKVVYLPQEPLEAKAYLFAEYR